MWTLATRVSHPSQTLAPSPSPLFTLWRRSPGQRPVCPLLGVCLCVDFAFCDAVSHLAPWPAALPFWLAQATVLAPACLPAWLLKTLYFPRRLISFARWKIAHDICDYSKPLNCLFLLHLPSCDRLNFIFTATLRLLFLCTGLFMFVSVQKRTLPLQEFINALLPNIGAA